MKNASSKIFLIGRENGENLAGFHNGATWRTEIEQIIIPADANYVSIPFTVEIQEDKTASHSCSDVNGKGVYTWSTIQLDIPARQSHSRFLLFNYW